MPYSCIFFLRMQIAKKEGDKVRESLLDFKTELESTTDRACGYEQSMQESYALRGMAYSCYC